MRVSVLGPVRAFDQDRELDLGGRRSRALVARLALESRRPVGVAVLIDDLWGEQVPADAANALQSVVSRTRRRLPPGALLLTPAGYVLDAEVDVDVFAGLVAAGDAAAALALWQGAALADVLDLPFAAGRAAALEDARLAALEVHLGAASPDPATVAALASLAQQHPYRDALWLAYLRALVSLGRSSEALTAYESLRGRLADELGTDPSPALQEVHAQILRGALPRDRSRDRLPVALTSFVGRDGALDDLRAALAEHRLVTVLGPGGSGKTRLAIETARAAAGQFAQVWVVELAPMTGGEDVAVAVAAAMGLLEVSVLDRSDPRTDARSRLLDGARDADGLLLLDNCEHVVEAAAEVAEALLARASRLRILATSREPLRLIGESTYLLAPLVVPAAGTSLAQATACSAVRLFVERARSADHGFALDEASLPAVREICSRLDGQPLALELAAARLRTMTVQEVAERLSDRFRLLTGGSRTALPRHRTLRAVVEWSWDLLGERERDLAERVAVFPAGVTAAGARAVSCDAGPDVAELLESLADKSLLVPVRGAQRYRMLETLREFGIERLVERGELDAVRSAHLDHVLALAERLSPHVRDHRQMAALAQVDLERGNLTAALRHAIDSGDRPRAARLTLALIWYWSIRNEHAEVDGWGAAVRELPGQAGPAEEIALAALGVVGALILRPGTEPWQPYVDRLLRLWDAHRPVDPLIGIMMATLQRFGLTGDRVLPEPADPWTRSMTSLVQLWMLENSGRLEEVPGLIEDTLAGFQACGDAWGLATVLGIRGMTEAAEGAFEQARATWSEALPLLERLGAAEDIAFARTRILSLRLAAAGPAELEALRRELQDAATDARRRGDPTAELMSWMGLAQVSHLTGDDAAAAEHLRTVLGGLSALHHFGSGQFEALTRGSYAAALAGSGDLAEARIELEAAVKVALAVQDMPVVAAVTVAAAQLAQAGGADEAASRLLGAARAIRGREDRSNRDAEDLARLLRERLGETRYEHAHRAGATLDRPAAIALLAGSSAPPGSAG